MNFRLWLAPSAVFVALLAGCAAQNWRGTADSDDAATKEDASAPVRPEIERPAAAAAGENLAQHTFSTEGRDFDPDLSPDGMTIVFASTSHSDRADIYVKDVDGFAVTQITGDPADDLQPRFSPDGSKIAFCSNRGGNWDIWIINRDGTGLVQLTRDRADEISPAWSPDGSQIAFSVWGSRSRQWEIWIAATASPGTRRFLAAGLFPSWSPDGTRIAFQRARQRGTRWFSVWAVDLVGDEARHPTELAYADDLACIAPRWSADGGSIVYCQVPRTGVIAESRPESPAVADVWIVDVRRGVRRCITDGSHAAFNPTYGPDGRVYFVSTRAGTENIWSAVQDAEIADPSPGRRPIGRRGDIHVRTAAPAGDAAVNVARSARDAEEK
jgi:TolB protein